MNTGIQDAISLAHVLAGTRSDSDELRNVAFTFAGYVPPIRTAIARNLAELDSQ